MQSPRNQLVNNFYEKAPCKTENIYGVYPEGLRRGYGAVSVRDRVRKRKYRWSRNFRIRFA